MMPADYYPCTQDACADNGVTRMIDEIMARAERCEQSNYDGFCLTKHHQRARRIDLQSLTAKVKWAPEANL